MPHWLTIGFGAASPTCASAIVDIISMSANAHKADVLTHFFGMMPP